jgi:broad specificity phosphatase PhoE
MTVIAFLRHAETAWSREKRIQGHTDVPLSSEGVAMLKDRCLPPDCAGMRVLTSPLARCVETAALLGCSQSATDARLIEMYWGAWEGRRLAQLREELGSGMWQNEALGFDFRPPGGESPREVLARVRPLLGEVASEAKPTLCIAHRGVIRVVLAAATGWDMLGRPPVKLDWQGVHLFKLSPDGTPNLLQENVVLRERPLEAPARS